jgi:hypothetical protein
MPLKTKARSVIDDHNALVRERGELSRRRDKVAGELAGSRARAAQLEAERKAEFAIAVREAREPNTSAIDERLTAEGGRQADLALTIAALNDAEARVEREIAALFVERRVEWADEARKMSALEAADRARLVKVGRELLASHTENARAWQQATRSYKVGDKLAPSLPIGFRLRAFVPGQSLADWITIPRSARTTVDHVERFDPIQLLRAVIEQLAEHPDALPAASVPPTSLVGRAGTYRNTVSGHTAPFDDADLASGFYDTTVDDLNLALWVRVGDLPVGYVSLHGEPTVSIDLGERR